ncbi:unnamed protein product, partial [Cuscuta campestris]
MKSNQVLKIFTIGPLGFLESPLQTAKFKPCSELR